MLLLNSSSQQLSLIMRFFVDTHTDPDHSNVIGSTVPAGSLSDKPSRGEVYQSHSAVSCTACGTWLRLTFENYLCVLWEISIHILHFTNMYRYIPLLLRLNNKIHRIPESDIHIYDDILSMSVIKWMLLI